MRCKLFFTTLFLIAIGAPFSLSSGNVAADMPATELPPGQFGCTLAVWKEQTENCPTQAEDSGQEPTRSSLSSPAQTTTQPFPFMPMAGTIWQDLYINNFVDLEPGSGIRDWDCSQYSYNGHNGLDIDLRTFREQEIGVPIFAVLDGTVTQTRDGEPDMNTEALGQAANFVTLDHGNGQRTQYLHLKRNSVAVSVGQVVKAGTQLGLTASSGNSTWPHLHLTPLGTGGLYEPTAGACRAGASNWTRQPVIRRDLYVRDFAVSDTPYSGHAAFDNNPRIGTFATAASRRLNFRIELNNLPLGSNYRFRFFRPDGSQTVTFANNLNNSAYFRRAFYYFFANLNLNVTGTWRVTVEINDRKLVDAPFEVVASAEQIANRPPLPINAVFDPPAPGPNDVIFCRVLGPLTWRDPDFDLVRYRYQWRINGNTVREVTSAALSDAIPKGTANNGDLVECTVTPADERMDGAPVTASLRLGTATLASVSAASFIRGLLTGESIVAAFGANLAAATQVANEVPLPTELGGTRVMVRDSVGSERLAPLFFVAPMQVNYLLPAGLAPGNATITVTNGGATATETAPVFAIAPGLFTANADGQGPPAAVVLRIKSDGTQSFEPAAILDTGQNKYVAAPIDLGPDLGAMSDQVFLLLFGTGVRGRSELAAVTARLAGIDLPVTFAGAQGLVGLDQMNIGLPRSLVGRGEADLTLVVDGVAANLVRVRTK